ncbi:hypothetical protein J7E50_10880 [Pedobacter sp. ISL-68]|uniref:hypothetical protein n=1 Tax=unclassified Pedobacter TaxID=2628915 RepID=UPI001BE8AF22|nr:MULTISPECIES: hypothetical protein [unclassified Pedobacter]MBT2561336.1 hypothetical protein [Pedobacter sp. ISL-64]MBT2590725.1 hypothetical protein [Pedobacter sp. ISL-68]
MTTNDVAVMYDALLSVPGMNEKNVKVDLKISRAQILLLSQAIRQGVKQETGMVKDLVSVLPKESSNELCEIADEFLQKAGLAELFQKLQAFAGK